MCGIICEILFSETSIFKVTRSCPGDSYCDILQYFHQVDCTWEFIKLNITFKDEKLLQRIKNRGPNCSQAVEIDLGNGAKLTFCGAVLWMRGPSIIPQPVQTDRGLLLYNGDIFNETWDINANDTLIISEKLGQHEVKVVLFTVLVLSFLNKLQSCYRGLQWA